MLTFVDPFILGSKELFSIRDPPKFETFPDKQPTYGNGKICFIEMPALDVSQSAAFYHEVFE